MGYKMIAKKLSQEEEKSLETVLEKESWLLGDEDDIKKNRALNFFRKIRRFFADTFHNARYALQRIFRSNHVADIDLWSLDFCMAKGYIPALKRLSRRKDRGIQDVSRNIMSMNGKTTRNTSRR
jgi:hypothetical protein